MGSQEAGGFDEAWPTVAVEGDLITGNKDRFEFSGASACGRLTYMPDVERHVTKQWA